MEPVRSAPVQTLALIVVLMALSSLARSRTVEPAPKDFAKVVAPRLSSGARALRDGRGLDVNSASLEDLQLLPRIGPALAGRIVAHRPFGSVEDLTRVPGIGPRTLEGLRALIVAENSSAISE